MAKSDRARTCAVMEHHEYLCEIDETYKNNRRAIESFSISARLAPRTNIIRIPVVVHVIYNTDKQNISKEQIDSQIDVLNRDFRFQNADKHKIPDPFKNLAVDTLIEFQLANRDPVGRLTTGVTRTWSSVKKFPYDSNDPRATANLDKLVKTNEYGKSAWPGADYLNIWVCAIESGLLGYAQFPGGAAATDGVVINHTAFGTIGTTSPPFDLGRTTVHEVGHWLNLLHIWGDDRGACSLSDNIHDTPNQAGPNTQKPSFPKISCNNGPHGDLFMNYMDYVDDDTMVMFTRGQLNRMNATLAGPRSSLAHSKALVSETTELISLPEVESKVVKEIMGAPKESGDTVELVFDGVSWVKDKPV